MIDGRRSTASGAAAAFDLMLRLIGERLGADVATEVACWFQHPLVRGEGVRQKIPAFRTTATDDMLPPAVARAVRLMAARIAEPVPLEEIAGQAGVSARQMERQFKQATGQSPSHYYRALRLKAARQLVVYSNDSMAEIAHAVGYASSTPLVQHYREAFGLTPQQDRARVNQSRVQDNRALPSV